MSTDSTRGADKMESHQRRERVAPSPSPPSSTARGEVSPSAASHSSRPSPPPRPLKRKAPTANPSSRLPLPINSSVPPLRPRPPLPSQVLQASNAQPPSSVSPSASREAEDLPSPGGFLTAENLRHRSKSLSHYSATTVSDTHSDSTVLSFSKFPRPPSGSSTAPIQEPFEERLPSTVYSPPFSRFTIDSQHTIIHRGTSFDIINPHSSLDVARLNALQRLNQSSEDPTSSMMDDDLVPPTATPQPRADSPSVSSIRSDKETPPSRAIFEDLPTAHSSILRVTNSHWRISPSGSSSDPGSPHPRALNVRKQPTDTEDSPVIPSPALLRSRPSETPSVEEAATVKSGTENRAPSPTWKDVFHNVFRRRDDSPTASEKNPNPEVKVASGLHPRPPSRKKNPFPTATDDQTAVPSHSLPVLVSKIHNTSQQSLPFSESESQLMRGKTSNPGALQTYQEQTDRLNRQALFASRGIAAMPVETEEASSSKADARSTVGSILKSYGDDPSDFRPFRNSRFAREEKTADKFQNVESSKAEKMGSGFSQFDFGITEGDARSVKSDPPHDVESSPVVSQNRTFPPPSAVLHPVDSFPSPPPIPESTGAPVMQRSRSSPSDQSNGSFFGDSRDVLGVFPGSQSFAASESNSSGKASSGALADLTDKDLNAGSRASPGAPLTSTRPRLGRNSSTQSRSQSRPTSEGLRAAGLEREISRELRRISQISGVSRLSGAVFVLNEGQISASPIDDRANGSDEENTYDHGGFQSSSSDNILDRAQSIDVADAKISQSHDSSSASQGLKPWKGKGKAVVDGRGSYGSSIGKTNSFRSQFIDEEVVDAGAEEEKEWETISGSRGFDRGQFEPDNSMIRELTGSSLADMSDNGEVVDPTRNNFARSPPRQDILSPVSEVLQHPADERFQHVYRMREVGPERESILIPTYNFSGTSSFPNRNTLSPPLPSETFADKSYQHPLPLSDGHVNPFKSSPPLVSSPPRKELERGKASDAQGFRQGQNGENTVHTQLGKGMYRNGDNGTSVRDFSKASKDETRQVSNQRHRDSSGQTALDRSFSSSVWMDTFGDIGEIGEIGSDVGDEPDLPSGQGSFAKISTLGPRANITGSPQGTNMRQVGSSLADKSSPGPPWTSSPNYPLSSSPAQPGSSRLFRGSSLIVPETAHQQDLQDGQTENEPGVLYDQIRVHREQLAAEGLLPRPFTPARKKTSAPQIGSLFGGSSRRPLDPEHGHQDSQNEPTSYLPTPPVPRVGLRRPLVFSQAHLRRHPRFDSDTGLALSRRKQQLSRIVFGLCLLFPPMLLVYGYGLMDSLMVSLSHGEITRFGNTEKRAALVLGYGLAVSAVIGIVVGMIVVGLSA